MTTNALNGIRVYDPATANQPTSSSTASTSASSQTQDFLTLLVAQIQNQDPTSPMDASTMTSQMSNLSMVQSMQDMNSSLTSLLAQMQASNFITQASSIGHSPLVAGNAIQYSGTGNVSMGASVTNALSDLTATITDSSGNVVNQVDLGAVQPGMTNFAWSGVDSNGNQLSAGKYYVQFVGTNAIGSTDASTTAYVASPVATVSKSADGKTVNLNLADGRVVDANSVTQWDS
jgi:flagellar basal-body rod modification protein FlgD